MVAGYVEQRNQQQQFDWERTRTMVWWLYNIQLKPTDRYRHPRDMMPIGDEIPQSSTPEPFDPETLERLSAAMDAHAKKEMAAA